MSHQRKVLGRGLGSLLPSRPVAHDSAADASPASTPASNALSSESVQQIPLNSLDRNPYQTRSVSFGGLDELGASIEAVGLLQPIVVRPVAGGRYQVIAGERRWEAVRQLRHRSIAAIVRPVSNEQAMEMTIVENLQRLELTCMEQARGYDQLAREFALTQEEMAERTGKQRSSVANFLRLLKLPSSVQAMLDKGQLSFGHAKVLMALESAEEVEQLAQRIVALSLSVRQTEKAATKLAHPRERAEKVRMVDPNVREAEHELQRALGVHVTITGRNAKGKILIEYSSREDFERILAVMRTDARRTSKRDN
ncbi:MAG: ParB/RepB/Spo0J family partition protein [Candidatus Korobacteraceae bacterium]|jgi:ParB family chromosome partitioning protein